MPDIKRIGMTELRRHLRRVLDEVAEAKTSFVIIRGYRQVAAIRPLDTLTSGQRIAAMVGFAGPEGDEFAASMKEVIEERHRRMPREVPEIPDE